MTEADVLVEEGTEDRRSVDDRVRELAFRIKDQAAVRDIARIRADTVAAHILSQNARWCVETATMLEAEAQIEKDKAALAALRGQVDAVDDLGCSFEFSAVRVTFPKRAVTYRLSADKARRLWHRDRAFAESVGIEEDVSEPRPPVITIRPLSATTAEAAIRAAEGNGIEMRPRIETGGISKPDVL